MKKLEQILKILDQKIENCEKKREQEIRRFKTRIQLVKELWERAKGRGVFISIKGGDEFFRVNPKKGFTWQKKDDGAWFPIEEAINLASKENLFSALLFAFLEGKAEVEVEI